MQPAGDTPTRRGIVDALLLGCIPVLFDGVVRAQWPWHWGSWVADATVVLNGSAVREGHLDVVGTLADMPAEQIRRMQSVIRQQAHSMQYSTHDTRPLRENGVLTGLDHTFEDAFDVLVRKAWERSQMLHAHPHAVGGFLTTQ